MSRSSCRVRARWRSSARPNSCVTWITSGGSSRTTCAPASSRRRCECLRQRQHRCCMNWAAVLDPAIGTSGALEQEGQMTEQHRITRRQFSTMLPAAAAAVGLGPSFADAQKNYPNRPVRFVVPFAAAGLADITTRLAAEKLGDKLGQRFVVENQPGPGGIAAARGVLSQAPDGYTIGLVTNGTAISAAIYKALPFDPVKEFATISTIGAFDVVFATNMESELKTLEDFIKSARAQPGTLNVATINVGSTQNLAAELFKASAGLNVQIIPYRGTPDVIVALLRNDVQLMVDFYAAMKSTLQNKNIREIVATPEVKQRYADFGIEAKASTPEELKARLTGDIGKWAAVIERAGIPKQ